MKIYKIAQSDYKGDHTSPCPGCGATMNDLTNVYPDDIYSSDGARLYGGNDPEAYRSISIIQSAKGRPNKSITIYRAVPDFNYEVNKELKVLYNLRWYYSKFKFFPVGDAIIEKIEAKYPIEQYGYDQMNKLVLSDLDSKIAELESKRQKKLKINAGDWVTISRNYAKEHGDSNLGGKYKILSKTVKASQLWTEGDSLYEWGYRP